MSVQSGQQKHHAAWIWLAVVAIVSLVAVVFHGVRNAALLNWDDDINILNNPHLRALTWENLRWMFTDVTYVRRYTPLAWLNWSLDHAWFGLTPRSCHVGNLLLHAANSVLVFFVIRNATTLWLGPRAMADRRRTIVVATLGALIWGIHPLRVEIVAWASGRIYCQAAFFALASTLSYLAMAPATPGTRRYRRFLVLAVTTLAMSLLTYPLALTHVGVLIILDIWILRRFERQPGPRTVQVWLEKVPFLVVTLAVLGATLWARVTAQGIWQPPPTLEQFGIVPRAMQGFYLWCYYLWKPLWPVELAPVYTTLIRFDPASWPFLISVVMVVTTTLVLVRYRHRWPGALALWLIHLVMLFPMLGLTEQPHYPNDRYSYLVAIPWTVALAFVVLRYWMHPFRRLAGITLLVAAIASWSFLSAKQVGVWRDNETLFRHMLGQLGQHPYRHDITMRLGEVLRTQGRLAEAAAQFIDALKIHPHSAFTHHGLARVYEAQGRTDPAVVHFAEAARLDPNWAEPHGLLGGILGRWGDTDRSITYLERAVILAPARAEFRADLGAALLKAGRTDEAILHCEAAVRSNPALPKAQFTLGLAYRAAGRMSAARTQLETALRLQPDHAPAREALTGLPAN